MSDRYPAYSIKAFPGNKSHGLAWTVQKRHLHEMAMIAYPNPKDGMGLLAYLICKEKYEEFYRQKHGVRPDEPNQLPTAIPEYEFPTIPLKSDFKDSNKDRLALKRAQDDWSKEIGAVQEFRAKLLASLDEIALSAVGTPDHRQTKTLAEIFSSLDLRFSRVTPAELGREIRKIRTPLATIPDFESVITSHHSLHQICADQNTPRSENDKIFDLQSALEGQSELTLALNLFDRQFELNNPERTFPEFVRQLRQSWQNNLPDYPAPTSTTSSHGYVNSVSKRKAEEAEALSPTPSQEAINRGIEALAQLGYTLTTTKAANTNKKPKRPKVFCEVHNWCGHTTEECRDANGKKLDKTHAYPKKGDKTHKTK